MWWIAVDDHPRGRGPTHPQNQGCGRGCFNLGCMAVNGIVLVVLGLLAMGFLIALVL